MKRFLLSALLALLVFTAGGDQTAASPNPSPSSFRAPSGFRALSGLEARLFVVPQDMASISVTELTRYGVTLERYQQIYGNATVFGGQITVIRSAGGDVLAVVGAHYPGIVPANAVRISRGKAEEVAARDERSATERHVELMIDPGSGRFFFRVDSRRMGGRWVHWIDAEHGRISRRYDALETNCDALSAPCGFGVEYDTDTTDVKDLSGLTTSSGSNFELVSADGRQRTYDQGSSNGPFAPVIATDTDDEWKRTGNKSPAQQPLVDVQYYANVMDDYLQAVYGFDWVAEAGPFGVSSMVLVGHYRKSYNNAGWDGNRVIFGDGDQKVFRELTSLDIVGHELTHGVIDFTSNLIYQDESGALNESFADILGNSLEFYAAAEGLEPGVSFAPDWLVGEDIQLSADTVAGFRNMGDPEEDGDPDHYSERYLGSSDNGGVHWNSGIPNHFYYLLVNGGFNASCASPGDHSSAHCTGGVGDGSPVGGIGLADAEQITFIGIASLPENATMRGAQLATVAVAEALFGMDGSVDDPTDEPQSVRDAWEAVGVTESLVPPDVILASIPFESAHPYADESDIIWTYDNGNPGFSFHFSSIDLEADFDYIYVLDARNQVLETITGAWPGGYLTVSIPTSVGKIRLVSDQFVTGQGFTVDAVEDTAGPVCAGLSQEAESGFLTGTMSAFADDTASGGNAIGTIEASGSNQGEAEYCVTVSAPGDYRIDTVVKGASGTSDSFWVAMDGGTSWLFDTNNTGAWGTDPVSQRGGADPVIVNLASGDHVLTINVREDGTQLDLITLTLVAADPVCAGLSQEAEAGVLTGTLGMFADGTASGGNAIGSAEGSGNAGPGAASYCFTVTTAGDYRIDTIVKGASSTSDSFWVQMDGGTSWLFDTDSSNAWVTDPVSQRGGADPVIVNLASGDHVLTINVREDGAQLDLMTLTLVAADPVCAGLSQEAEAGVLTGTLGMFADGTASGGNAIGSAEGSGNAGPGAASYCFTVTTAGDYRIDTIVKGASSTSDSFWVQMDGGTSWLFDTDNSNAWVTDPVSQRGGADPVIVNLASGDHALMVQVREDGTQLDRITLTLVAP